MKQKQRFTIAFLAVFLISFLVAILRLEGVNFQASILRTTRLVAAKIAPKPEPTVFLPMKFFKQEHALSCEAATLRMVLAYHGVPVSEAELIAKIGFDTTQKSGGIWGDPDKGFVGNIDGKMMINGYGVYAAPIARTANQYRSAVEFYRGNERTLIYELLNGNPIIIWGHLGNGKEQSWKTPEGKIIKAVQGEHTKIVHGFKGSAEKPDGFFLLDPIYGEVYESTAKLMAEWSKLDFSGVIVYNQAP